MSFQVDVVRGASPCRSLILSGNICLGYQVSSLLDNHGGQSRVVHRGCDAYKHIKANNLDMVVADIDTADLGGLAALIYCHNKNPDIAIYAIVQKYDRYLKMLARDLAGCKGFFYLKKGELKMDTGHGMVASLLTGDKAFYPLTATTERQGKHESVARVVYEPQTIERRI